MITAEASDDAAVARVEFFIGRDLVCTDTLPPYSCDWLVPDIARPYSLRARAWDIAGKRRNARTVRVFAR